MGIYDEHAALYKGSADFPCPGSRSLCNFSAVKPPLPTASGEACAGWFRLYIYRPRAFFVRRQRGICAGRFFSRKRYRGGGLEMAPHTYRYAYRVLYRKSGAGHSGVKSPGRGCNERSGIGKRDEPVSVHRRFRQRRAYDAAGADRAAHLLDCHSRLYHRADFIETCSEDVCRYCI